MTEKSVSAGALQQTSGLHTVLSSVADPHEKLKPDFSSLSVI